MNKKKVSLGKLSCFSRGSRKKGISAVVATVLIILITVAAVTIIWAAIIPMINENLQRGTLCFDAETALMIENKGFTCFNAGVDVKVQVSHGSKDIGLVDIQFLVSDDAGDTTSYMSSDATVVGNIPGINGGSVFTITHTDPAQSVSIAPVITIGGQEETCGDSAPISLDAC